MAAKILLLAISAITITAQGAAGKSCEGNLCCSEGWEIQRHSDQYNATFCYRFVANESLYWSTAQSKCRALSGSLISVNSRGELDYMIRRIREILTLKGQLNNRELWWTCGKKTSTIGFIWDDGSSNSGSRVDAQSSWWYPGQPDHGLYDSRLCLYKYNSQWGLNDVVASYKLRYVCEKRPAGTKSTVRPSVPTTRSTTSGSFNDIGITYTATYINRFYIFPTWLGQNHTNARRTCQSYGADLVTLSDDVEKNFVSSFLAGKSMTADPHQFWTSGSKQNGYWFWGDNTKVNSPLWLRGEPNNVGGVEDTVAIRQHNSQWGLNDENGHKLHSFVCESSIRPASLQFKARTHDAAYGSSKYTIVYDFALSINKAKSQCTKWNAHLVVINSASEFTFLVKTISDLAQGNAKDLTTGFWTAGIRSGSEFVWDVPGKPRVTYQRWLPGEPNNVGNNEKYMTLRYISTSRTWGYNDYNGKGLQRFVCEKELQSTSTTTTESTTTFNRLITPKYNFGTTTKSTYGSRVYIFPTWVAQAHSNAKRTCQSWGGDLLTLNSDAEKTFVVNHLTSQGGAEEYKQFWTSGFKSPDWQWGDGTAIQKVSWKSGEPNNYNGVEDAAAFRSGRNGWGLNDMNQYRFQSFVCETSRNPSSVSFSPKPLVEVTHGSSEYRIVFDYGVNRKMAKEQCKTWDSHLVVINSESELNFLIQTLKSIGGGDMKLMTTAWWTAGMRSGSRFVWDVPGYSALKYSKWLIGEPNNAGGSERYLTLGYRWQQRSWGYNDLNEMKWQRFICEKAIKKKKVPTATLR